MHAEVLVCQGAPVSRRIKHTVTAGGGKIYIYIGIIFITRHNKRKEFAVCEEMLLSEEIVMHNILTHMVEGACNEVCTTHDAHIAYTSIIRCGPLRNPSQK